MKFKDIPGHESVKHDLRSTVSSGRIPHALMLSGPAGTGKMMLARAFATLLHCSSPRDGEPCETCASCRLHAENSHPDLHFVYPIVKNKSLKRLVSADVADLWLTMLDSYPEMPEEKWIEIIEAGNSRIGIHVEEADDIVRADSFPPYTSQYKIFIIWLPERMRVEAANKLLKVIEEPSEGTVFILVSDNELQVLPTIFSRVRRIHAGRLSEAETGEYLRRRFGFSEEKAMRYAPLCEGSLIRACELGSHSDETEEFLAFYQEVMRAAYAKKVGSLRKAADRAAAFGREKISRFLNYMARMIRENFIYNMRMPQLTALTPEEEAFSTRFSPFVNHANVEDFLAETDRARRDVERNANAKVVMFDYFLMTIKLLHRKTKQP